MKKIALTSAIILSVSSLGSVAHACDLHSGFNFGASTWRSYNPQVSKTDPALANKKRQSEFSLRPAKRKPSFSNAANAAATKAKAQWATAQRRKKPSQTVAIKKAAGKTTR